MMLHGLPPFAVIQFHPVILAILHFSSILQRLSEKLTEIIIVGGIFKTQISDVAEVFAELLCNYNSV